KRFVEAAGYQTEAEKYGFGQSRLEKPDETITPEMKKLNWRAPGPGWWKPTDQWPVTQITWNDAVAFCNWLSEQEKLQPCYRMDEKAGWVLLTGLSSNGVPKAENWGYRLPTEAEWEFACRAGTDTQFSFGDDPAMLGQFAWWGSQRDENAVAHPSPVATKQANPFGLFDMHGNASEWCQDFGKSYYASSPPADPPGPSEGGHRTSRGGHYANGPANCRSAFRIWPPLLTRGWYTGFRVARTLPLPEPEIRNARELAQWVIGMGGSMELNKKRGSANATKKVADLPAKVDRVFSINGMSGPTIDDALVRRMVTWRPLPSNLTFENSAITDAGLRAIGYRFGGLSHFWINGSRITGEGFDAFRGKNVGSGLSVSDCPLTAAGMERIGELGKISSLYASNCGLQDAWLAPIGKHVEMDGKLKLLDNPITDAGLIHLEPLKSLKSLELGGTKVTAAGVEKLQKALPNCKITWQGSPAAPASAAAAPPAKKLDFPDIKTPRELAEWTLAVGGQVNAGISGGLTGAVPAEIAAKDFQLTSVRFDKLALDDAALARMARWPLPAAVNLTRATITDAGLRQLAAWKPGEAELSIDWTPVTGAGFDAHKGKTFGYLSVSHCPISREGWARIGDLQLVGRLRVGGSKLSDESLIALVNRQPKLQILDAPNSPLTDAALEPISRLPQLSILNLMQTG
ncbi:MAG TPA: SUMF1/EgtB/PvdO family nonheme iron enzyme, partial [Pirellulales bacterium]|nr:SUMF1/EgtB/PvdO family nonheme iron enzyme [Pirellulales bacterium]